VSLVLKELLDKQEFCNRVGPTLYAYNILIGKDKGSVHGMRVAIAKCWNAGWSTASYKFTILRDVALSIV